MKINVEIDCTPLEALQFMGLPDVQPMQKAMMEDMEARMKAEMDKLSPENLMKSWFSASPQNAEWMQQIFSQFLTPKA